MEDILGLMIGMIAVIALLIGLPWLLLHYITKWRQAPKITVEDEQLLDQMFTLARRLEERLVTVERIAAADHPDWKPGLTAPATDWQAGTRTPQSPYPLERRN